MGWRRCRPAHGGRYLKNMTIRKFITGLCVAFIAVASVRGHEEGAEDKSPIPVTLGATWQAILKKQAELQGATASQSLPTVHQMAFRLRDLCNTLPKKSPDLPSDKLARVNGAVKNIAKLTDELDKTGDAGNQAGTDANVKKLEGVLKLLASQYDAAKLADTSAEPKTTEATLAGKEHAHSDHESKRGGVLMMKDDWHIEGVQVDNQFRVYLFNEFTRPVPVGKITGKLVLPLPPGAKSDADEPTTPLQLSKDGMYLHADRPAVYPDDALTVRLVLDGQESSFSFPIFKTTDATCSGCSTKTIAGLQAVSACGMCSGKLNPKDGKIACTKCAAPISYTLAALGAGPLAPAAVVTTATGSGETIPMKRLLESYYEVQKALAADDLKTASAKAKNLAAGAGKLAEESKQPELATLSQSAKSLSESKDLKAARKAFGDASLALIDDLAKTPGVGAKYYILHCPMAKVGNGDWVQPNPVTSNPYFGSEMLRCGSVKKEVK